MNKVIKRYHGFMIRDNDEGYFWDEGGYFDTIAECQHNIDAYNADRHSDENVYGLVSVQQSIMEDKR